MTACIAPGFPLSQIALLLAALSGAGAHATASTEYVCKDYRRLSAEITPQEAQVHFEGSDWTLKRVHDNGEARYVNSREGVTIITKGRALTFMHHSERLPCKLLSDALGPPKAPSAPSGALSTSAPVAAK